MSAGQEVGTAEMNQSQRVNWLPMALLAIALSACAVNPVPTPGDETANKRNGDNNGLISGDATASDTGRQGATDTLSGGGGADDAGSAGGADTGGAAADAGGVDDAGAGDAPTSADTEDSTSDDGAGDADTDQTDTVADTSTAPDTAVADASEGFLFSSLTAHRGWGPCPPNMVCSESWELAQDGAMSVTKKGVTAAAQMSATDLTAVKALLKDQAFIDGITKGFVCNQPPTDIFLSLELKLSGAIHKQTVTGCVLSGPSGNTAAAMFKLLSAY